MARWTWPDGHNGQLARKGLDAVSALFDAEPDPGPVHAAAMKQLDGRDDLAAMHLLVVARHLDAANRAGDTRQVAALSARLTAAMEGAGLIERRPVGRPRLHPEPAKDDDDDAPTGPPLTVGALLGGHVG